MTETPTVPQTSTTALDLDAMQAACVAQLRTVFDPELPVNIYDLGLIYGIDIDASGDLRLTMTLTSPGCPMAEEIVTNAAQSLQAVPGVRDIAVELTFNPPWSQDLLSEEALLELGLL
ncbi:MAG: iron-sulfur cluster assembly protein [Bacteroidota bacterium]